MPPLPRGRCPHCRADIALRKNGRLREHRDRRHELYATGQNELVPVCEGSAQPPVEAVTDLAKTEALAAGDRCEFRYPAVDVWRPGIVVHNGGSGYWQVRNEATGELAHGLYIEHVRAPGTDPWGT